MKRILLPFIFLSSLVISNAQTFQIEHYDISVDTIDFTNESIVAHTELDVEALSNGVNTVSLSSYQYLSPFL